MTLELVSEIIRRALITVLVASSPALAVGLLVGLAIGVFQAVSQIHEVTLAFIPKIVAIFVSLMIFGPWVIKVIVKFSISILSNLNNYTAM